MSDDNKEKLVAPFAAPDSTLVCVRCGKMWERNEDGWVYHSSRGVVCLSHPGVVDWYNDLISAANMALRVET